MGPGAGDSDFPLPPRKCFFCGRNGAAVITPRALRPQSGFQLGPSWGKQPFLSALPHPGQVTTPPPRSIGGAIHT